MTITVPPSSSDICSASPFDLDGQLDNILTRLDRVEQVLSELLGVDITTIQLSDITQNGGNILSLNLGSSALANIVTQIGKSNVFMISLSDTVLAGDNVTSIGYSPTGEYTASSTVNSFAGASSSGLYHYYNAPFNGGFRFECRMMLGPGLVGLPIPQNRTIVGMGEDLFRSGADNNTDAPQKQYICFSYSQPRGDTTWKFMLDNNPTGLGLNPWHQVIVDTGVTIINSHWYDFVIDCRPTTNSIDWSVTDAETLATGSGTIATPDIVHGSDGYPNNVYSTYQAGVGVFTTVNLVPAMFDLHHIFCQSINLDRV